MVSMRTNASILFRLFLALGDIAALLQKLRAVAPRTGDDGELPLRDRLPQPAPGQPFGGAGGAGGLASSGRGAGSAVSRVSGGGSSGISASG